MYTEEELSSMTISLLKKTAEENGYSITKTVKKEIIEEILLQQKEAGT